MNTVFKLKNDPKSIIFNTHDVFWAVNSNNTNNRHGPNWFGRRRTVNVIDKSLNWLPSRLNAVY